MAVVVVAPIIKSGSFVVEKGAVPVQIVAKFTMTEVRLSKTLDFMSASCA